MRLRLALKLHSLSLIVVVLSAAAAAAAAEEETSNDDGATTGTTAATTTASAHQNQHYSRYDPLPQSGLDKGTQPSNGWNKKRRGRDGK